MLTLHVFKLVTDVIFQSSCFVFKNRSDQAGAVKAEAAWVKADVILAADGVMSKAWAAMMVKHGQFDTGSAAVSR